MCLIVLAWMSHPAYRLVVAANRDELHDRPTAPLGWWHGDGGIVAGRDLTAGGTWMGVTRAGRFGALTNFRDLEMVAPPDAPSRGTLVPEFLAGDVDPSVYMGRIRGVASRFAGFNLLAGGPRGIFYFSNRGDDGPRQLAPGVYGLANEWLDSPWPKLLRARERFTASLAERQPDPGQLFDLLADRAPAPRQSASPARLPEDLQRALSAPFVMHPRYGTRCSTVLLVAHDGRTVIAERRFDAAGRQTGASRIEFVCEATEQ